MTAAAVAVGAQGLPRVRTTVCDFLWACCLCVAVLPCSDRVGKEGEALHCPGDPVPTCAGPSVTALDPDRLDTDEDSEGDDEDAEDAATLPTVSMVRWADDWSGRGVAMCEVGVMQW